MAIFYTEYFCPTLFKQTAVVSIYMICGLNQYNLQNHKFDWQSLNIIIIKRTIKDKMNGMWGLVIPIIMLN